MFIQIMQGPCNREEELRGALDSWRNTCEAGAVGFLGGTYGFTDDGQFVAVVRFASREAAMQNSARPEQGAWWAATEPLFSGPVQFHDSDDVTVLLDGGSDDAGFVQVMHGHVTDADAARKMMSDGMEMLHEARPDVIGGTFAMFDDGSFTETIAFTDEASARKAETQEMPPEIREQMENGPVQVEAYLDLHRPFFATHA